MRLILLLPVLAACTQAAPLAPPVEAPSAPYTACGAPGLSGLLGQPLAALPGSGPWGALRVIRPGDAVTEDFSESRLNVSLNAADRIIALTCG